MGFSLGPELNLFCLNDRLFLLGFLLLFLQLIPVLIKIHNPTDRRIGLTGNLDQVQILVICNIQSFLYGHNPELFAIRINKPDFRVPDCLINLNLNLLLLRKFPASSFNVQSS